MNKQFVHSQTTKKRVFLGILAAIGIFSAGVTQAVAQDDVIGRTPPRLSYIDGEASFWRPGADDWSAAEVNLPLAPGDQLYTADRTNIELQIGARGYLRAAENTQFGLENQEPDFVQMRVTGGQVALDLRELTPGHTVEIDTPQAAFTIQRAGYYRAVINQDATSFVVRRGGSALATPSGGAVAVINDNEQGVIRADYSTMETYAAGETDNWDGWNYGRTDQYYATSQSRQYVADDVYGAEELDNHGSWRNVPSYGSVWVPRTVRTGWSPYSDGRWIYDPYYGWTWLAAEPWGYAPFHYGRWVYTDDYWAWAPGPRVSVGVYSPALVAFFGGGGFRVGVSVGVPVAPVGWVSLSWGEPVYPWWGPSHYHDRPYWGGWGGDRVVINNTKIVNKTKIINNVDGYRNSRYRDGMVVVKGDRFGRGDVRSARLDRYDRQNFRALRSNENVKPGRESLRARDANGKRPPRELEDRKVVATRAPRDTSSRLRAAGLKPDVQAEARKDRVRLVKAPRADQVTRTRRQDSVERNPSNDGDKRNSRASVPNPRNERELQTGPNRERREQGSREVSPPVPGSSKDARQPRDTRQPRVDNKDQNAPQQRQNRDAAVPRGNSRSAEQPRIDRRQEQDARKAAPPVPNRSRVDRQTQEPRQAGDAPERRGQAAPRQIAPEQRREQRPEMSAPRREAVPRQERQAPRKQQVEPERESRRMQPQREARPQRVPQARQEQRVDQPRQERVERAQPRQAPVPRAQQQPRQQRVERAEPQPRQEQRVERAQPQRPQRSARTESRQERRNSKEDRGKN